MLDKNAVLDLGKVGYVFSDVGSVAELSGIEGFEGGRCEAVCFSKVGELVAKCDDDSWVAAVEKIWVQRVSMVVRATVLFASRL